MEFYEVLNKRQSIRSFLAKPVPQSAIDQIRKAVQLAPTACNKQPVKVIFIKDADLIKRLASSTVFPWIASAQAVAVVAGNSEQCWKRFEGDPIIDVDCAIVMEHIVLAAAAEGLGSCWVCAYDRQKIDDVIGLPAPWRSVALAPMGYAAQTPARPPRKPDSEIFEVR